MIHIFPFSTSSAFHNGPNPMKTLRDALQMAGVYWNHILLSPVDAALGRIDQRTREREHGGLYNLFKHTFGIVPGEELLKTYSCYISAPFGPEFGTLYISSKRLAFCSYSPLLIELKSKGMEAYDKFTGFTAFEEVLSTLTDAIDAVQRERLLNPFGVGLYW